MQAGVRVKNQRAALFRAVGKGKQETHLESDVEQFVLEGIDRSISTYENEKERYEAEFARLAKKYKTIKLLKDIPGIGVINATKLAAVVVDPRRFQTKGDFLSYCGLVKLTMISGGNSYGQRSAKYSRTLKCVFKSAALVNSLECRDNIFKDFYLYLIKEKKYPEHLARHTLARRIAVLALGVMKSGKKFNYRGEEAKKENIKLNRL